MNDNSIDTQEVIDDALVMQAVCNAIKGATKDSVERVFSYIMAVANEEPEVTNGEESEPTKSLAECQASHVPYKGM